MKYKQTKFSPMKHYILLVVIGNQQRVRQFATFAGILSAGTEFNCIKFFFIAITFELY